jgi:hypothetical protein
MDGRGNIYTDRQTDGRTDMTQIIGAFRDYTIALKFFFRFKKNLVFTHELL